MQYLFTEEEYKSLIPASVVQPFAEALASYYDRKNQHLLKCISTDYRDLRSIKPLDDAVAKHRREWTEKPPEPKDFIK